MIPAKADPAIIIMSCANTQVPLRKIKCCDLIGSSTVVEVSQVLSV